MSKPNQETKTVNEQRPAVTLEPWTVDIREKGDISDKYVDTLQKNLAEKGKKLWQLYCTDAQREKLEKVDAYKGIVLTVE